MKLYALILISILTTNIYGQRLVSYELLQSVSRADLSSDIGFNTAYGADYYKIFYTTPNVRGEDHTATGLLLVPISEEDLRFPLACYQHGTVGTREDVPSRISGESRLAAALAGAGYVTVAPDYIGLGDSPGLHPYVHADTEASAGVDLLLAAREMQEEIDLKLNDQLFLTGYSQGGHAAFALHREIELNYQDVFTITASAPMSGPYSISDKMVEFTLGDDMYNFVAYLAWSTLSFIEAHPDLLADFEIADIFKAEYLEDIEDFRVEDISLWNLNSQLGQTLVVNTGALLPKNMIESDILDALFNDPSHPLSQALAANDLIDWTTQTPTNLYYCEGDEQVTFENAILASETMTNNGSPNVAAIRMDTDQNPQDHGRCAGTAPIAALFWFNSFQEISSLNGMIIEDADIQISNQDNNLFVEINEIGFTEGQLSIHNLSGQLSNYHNINTRTTTIDISQLPQGMYIVTVSDGHRMYKAVQIVK